MESYNFVITPNTVTVDKTMDDNDNLYDPMMGLSPTTRANVVVRNMHDNVRNTTLIEDSEQTFGYSLHEENTMTPKEVAVEIAYRLATCFAGKAFITASIVTEEGIYTITPEPRELAAS